MNSPEVKSKYGSVILLCGSAEKARDVVQMINSIQPRLCICLETNHNIQSALDFVKNMYPDLLILEPHLNPGKFDGLWLAAELLASNYSGKVVFKSGLSSDTDNMKFSQVLSFSLIGHPVDVIAGDTDSIIECLFSKGQ